MPLPNLAGVSVPRRGSIIYLNRGTGGAHVVGGLGFFDAIASIGGAIIGGIFGNKSEKRKAALARDQMNLEAGLQRDSIAAERYYADIQAGAANRSIDAALVTSRIQAENELYATNSAYATQLAAQRVQGRIAGDVLSAQLVGQTQAGIFGLANRGIIETSNVVRAFPRAGTMAAATMVAVALLAMAYVARGSPKFKRGKRGGPGKPKNGRMLRGFGRSASASPDYSPSFPEKVSD